MVSRFAYLYMQRRDCVTTERIALTMSDRLTSAIHRHCLPKSLQFIFIAIYSHCIPQTVQSTVNAFHSHCITQTMQSIVVVINSYCNRQSLQSIVIAIHCRCNNKHYHEAISFQRSHSHYCIIRCYCTIIDDGEARVSHQAQKLRANNNTVLVYLLSV